MNQEVKGSDIALMRETITPQLRTWVFDRLNEVSSLDLEGVDLKGLVMLGRREGPHPSRLDDGFGAGA